MVSSDSILLAGINPFDRTHHYLQKVFDREIIKLIAEISNLNVSLVTNPLITDIGSYDENPDSWIAEQIVNGTAQMSSSTVILTPDSQTVISYSFGVGSFRPQIYYKAISLREDNNIYLIPFSTKLWLYFIATAFLLIIALMFILAKEAKLPHEISYDVLARTLDVQQDRDDDCAEDITGEITSKEVLLQKEKWETGEILLVCLGAPCQQGSARDPSTNAARIIILCLFGLAVVGYTAYSASLISIVSLYPSTEHEYNRQPKLFLRRYKTLLYSINKINDLHLDFDEIEVSDLRKGFQKVWEGKAVFVGDRDISLTFFHQQRYKTNMRCTLGRSFLGVDYQKVFVLKKYSKHEKTINHNILRLQQFGLLNREKRKIFNIESPCSLREKLSTPNFISFNEKDVKPVMNLYTYGVLTSLLLLVVENIFFLCKVEIKKCLQKHKKHQLISKAKQNNLKLKIRH